MQNRAWFLFLGLAAYMRIWGVLQVSKRDLVFRWVMRWLLLHAHAHHTNKWMFHIIVCIFFGIAYDSIWCFKGHCHKHVEKWYKCVSYRRNRFKLTSVHSKTHSCSITHYGSRRHILRFLRYNSCVVLCRQLPLQITQGILISHHLMLDTLSFRFHKWT